MTVLSFLSGLIQLVVGIVNYLHDQGMIKNGEMAAFQAIMKGQADDLQKKLDAMAAAGKRFDDTGGMPDDGQYRD
jgi:hypothetical protein